MESFITGCKQTFETVASKWAEVCACQCSDEQEDEDMQRGEGKKKFQRKEKTQLECLLAEEGGLNEFFYRDATAGPHSALGLSTVVASRPVLEDFESLRGLGAGAFGKVYLVRCKRDKKIYAMKAIRKDVILDAEMVESTQMEKQILEEGNHPFLVGAEYVFQTDLRIFFVMRYVVGGELFRHLQKAKNKRILEDRARFYAAQVAMALGHLHSKKILYRDLKPENLLMEQDGYICLTDFGMAKKLGSSEMTASFCGTSQYLAPEMLNNENYTYSVDWWALGILVYEMIVGFAPFYTGSSDNRKMYKYIQRSKVFFPDPQKHKIYISDSCKAFIAKCLAKDPADRLGAHNDVDEVLQHDWFEDLDLDAVRAREIEPDYLPKVGKKDTDSSNFSGIYMSKAMGKSLVPLEDQEKVKEATEQELFSGF